MPLEGLVRVSRVRQILWVAPMGFTYIAGRFSLVSKSIETIEDTNQLWNPTCGDTLDLGFQYENLIKGAAADAVNTVNPKVRSSHNARTHVRHRCSF
eukprot:8033416-Pyramimonas_sp.AAC.3